MKSYSEYIGAGETLKLPGIGGRVLYIQRSQGGPVLNVEFINRNAGSQVIERVGKGFRAAPVGGFEGISIKATAAGVVDFVVTDGDIAIQFDEDMTTIGNDDGQAIPVRVSAGQRLPVEIGGSTVTVTADNVGINNTDANAVPVAPKVGAEFTVVPKAGADFRTRGYLAATVTDFDPLAVGDARVLLLAADAARRGLRFKNTGENPVAVGGVAVTVDNAVILIQPGETWNENEAPGAAWWCVCGAGLASNLNLQTIA